MYVPNSVGYCEQLTISIGQYRGIHKKKNDILSISEMAVRSVHYITVDYHELIELRIILRLFSIIDSRNQNV